MHCLERLSLIFQKVERLDFDKYQTNRLGRSSGSRFCKDLGNDSHLGNSLRVFLHIPLKYLTNTNVIGPKSYKSKVDRGPTKSWVFLFNLQRSGVDNFFLPLGWKSTTMTVKILRLKFGRDFDAEVWSRF